MKKQNILVFIVICAIAGFTPRTAVAQATKDLRVLFIGNSYTAYNELPIMVKSLVDKSGLGDKITVESVIKGGATLESHWKEGTALDKIREGGWDFVVLQEQSTRPMTDRVFMYNFGERFDSEIKYNGGRTVLFLTWSRETNRASQGQLNAAYLGLAEQLDAIVAPVGIAWWKAIDNDTNLELYDRDGNHPNIFGSYLAACIFYAVFFDKSPEGLANTVTLSGGGEAGVQPNIAEYLQEIAWQTVQENK